MSARRVAALAAAVALALAAVARAEVTGSALALPAMTASEPPLPLFAQRAIDREWGLSEDSVYTTIRIPDWKSEGLAMALSAGVPGTGQLYAGESSGYLYLLAEAAGWISSIVLHHRADQRRDAVAAFAGAPTDSTSGWSAARWALATGGDPGALEQLYAADPNAYWETVASDDRYLAGWAGHATSTRATFQSLRDVEQRALRYGRFDAWGLMLNHVVSMADAFRAAHIHNIPLRRDLELRLKGGWREGAPTLMAAVERRF